MQFDNAVELKSVHLLYHKGYVQSMTNTAARVVKAGRGGTIHFDCDRGDDHTLGLSDYVGTYGCLICVGVYFKISRSTAFLAHIKAHRSDSRDVDVADGEYIKSYVIRRLDQESRLHRWTPQEVDYSSLLLVCPMPNQFGAGSYVIDGVKNFLRIPNECIASNRLEGFLVNHKTGQTVTVNNRGVTQTEAIPSELAGFQLREETGSEWIFTL